MDGQAGFYILARIKKDAFNSVFSLYGKIIARGLLDQPLDFKLKQDRHEFSGFQGKPADQIVAVNRIRTQCVKDSRFCFGKRRQGSDFGSLGTSVAAAKRKGPVLKIQLIQNILNMFHQLGALFDQNMGSGAFE